MKEDLEKLYGREWRWYRSLTMGQQMKVIWFALSLGTAMGLGDDSNIVAMLLLALDMAASAVSLLTLPKLKD